jgi:hypothetical protein
MECPALGIWVVFLKQPALPGEAPQKKFLKKISKKNSLIKNHKWIKSSSKIYNFNFFGALGQAVHQAVSKKRPKSPKLDIPFEAKQSLRMVQVVVLRLKGTKKSIIATNHDNCNLLTVSISLSQQLQVHGKSYFWTNIFLQPPETQKTSN